MNRSLWWLRTFLALAYLAYYETVFNRNHRYNIFLQKNELTNSSYQGRTHGGVPLAPKTVDFRSSFC